MEKNREKNIVFIISSWKTQNNKFWSMINQEKNSYIKSHLSDGKIPVVTPKEIAYKIKRNLS